MRPPQLGDIVLYRLTEEDSAKIEANRSNAESNLIAAIGTQNGLKTYEGTFARPGDIYPMLVTVLDVAPGSEPEVDTWVCGRVFLNGNDDMQVQNVGRGREPGTWQERP